jgi:hypothetical protein
VVLHLTAQLKVSVAPRSYFFEIVKEWASRNAAHTENEIQIERDSEAEMINL